MQILPASKSQQDDSEWLTVQEGHLFKGFRRHLGADCNVSPKIIHGLNEMTRGIDKLGFVLAGGGGTLQEELYGYVPPTGVVIF